MRNAPPVGWKFRAKIFAQRFWQPTSACMMCMPGSLGHLWSAFHWETAFRTGAVTGLLALALSFTPMIRVYRNRFGNALAVGAFTVFADSYAHPNHYGSFHAEALLTGAVSASFALVGSYLLEDRARRVRDAWRIIRSNRREGVQMSKGSVATAKAGREKSGAG